MSFARLSGISLSLLAACMGMGYAFHRTFVKNMSENPVYLEAMQTVKEHNGAKYLLGEPIESRDPVLANKGMLLCGYSDIQVRVSGPKEKGIVFLKVTEGEKEKIKVDSIHLQIGKDQSKRLLIKDIAKESNISKLQEACNQISVPEVLFGTDDPESKGSTHDEVFLMVFNVKM